VSRPLQALVAIQYDDGETYVWKLTEDVEVDEGIDWILAGAGASRLPHFQLCVRGRGQRLETEVSDYFPTQIIFPELEP
jgi:hypothetical protein